MLIQEINFKREEKAVFLRKAVKGFPLLVEIKRGSQVQIREIENKHHLISSHCHKRSKAKLLIH